MSLIYESGLCDLCFIDFIRLFIHKHTNGREMEIRRKEKYSFTALP